MQHIIENDFLKITIRDFGGELTSIVNKKNSFEHLWQADPAFWGWHAPVLFPVVGRCLDDTILIDGVAYSMEKHGFARKSDFAVAEKKEESIQFLLRSNEATQAIYPYDFSFYITYTLQEDKLICTYTVINNDTKIMLFSLGGHPAFKAPLIENERYEDYYIEFENDTALSRYFIDEFGFFTGEKKVVMSGTNKLPLFPAIFAKDAYIFKDLKSRKVTLRSINHGHGTAVSFPDFDYLGLWAKENAPYVCIEPWRGCADTAGKMTSFDEKEGIISLSPGEKFEAVITIHIF